MGTRRKMGRKSVVRPRTSYGLANGSQLSIIDNSGAKIGKIINVDHRKTRQRRLPMATVGDVVSVSIKKGKPEMRGNIMKCVIVRQKRIYRRVDGTRLCFEDNAGVLITAEGDPKGTEIRGPISREAAELFPRLASISSLII
ncbi:MAG: 50S ribosomal protein L14 [Candidatus Lokiarchaeota archaeon]